MPIGEAVTALQAAMPELQHWDTASSLYAAGKHAKKLEKKGGLAPLTRDQAVAVHLYSQGVSHPEAVGVRRRPLTRRGRQRRRCTRR